MRSILRLTTWLAPGIRATLFEAVRSHLERVLDCDVVLTYETATSGPDPTRDPLLTGDADLGWMCATAYVQRGRPDDLVGVAWVPDDPAVEGWPAYFSDVVARTPIGDLGDLEGLRIGCNDPISLSGWLALRIALGERGHDASTFVQPVFTGGHLASLTALDRGDLDAAVIDSVTRCVEAPGLDARLRLGPWPTQPLVAAPGMDASMRERVRQALLVGHHDAALAAALATAGLVGFGAVAPEDYAELNRRLGH